MSLVAGEPRAAVTREREVDAALERRAQAHRLLLEAEMRLQTGAERDEETIVPLAAGLLRDILGGDPAIICYTFDTDETEGGRRELRLRWRYGYEPPANGSGPIVAAVPLLLDGDVAAQTARGCRPRLWQRVEGEARTPVEGEPGEDVRGGAEARARFSILSVPILATGDVLGVFNAYRPAIIPFDADDLDAATTFARGVGLALRNARHNARLAENGARARELVEGSPDTIILHTAEGRIIEANAAAGELIGLPPERIVGTILDDYLTPEAHAPLREQIAAVLSSPPPYPHAELRYRRPDGVTGLLHLRTRRLRENDPDGVPLLQSIARDVTSEQRQRKALETKVRELDLLIGVGENLNSSLQLEAVLRKTLRALA
jgi:PAS domain S-box-containing protein